MNVRVCVKRASAMQLICEVFLIAIGATLAHDFKRFLKPGDDLMKKIAHGHHTPPRAPNPFLPVVTLGFYGLRRFRPHWLYVVTALLLLAGWVLLAYFAGTIQPGGEYALAPLVFVMAIVTFFRLMPPTSHRAAGHR
jgi:hypothetical protein